MRDEAEGDKMRKFVSGTVIVAMLFGMFLLWSCEEDQAPSSVGNDKKLNSLIGEWECEANPLNDPNNYTGYLKLEISRDGNFSLYDAEEDSLGISGSIIVLDDSSLQILCADNSEFDPPPIWYNMRTNQIFTYEFKTESKEKLLLTFEDDQTGESSTLIFNKVKK